MSAVARINRRRAPAAGRRATRPVRRVDLGPIVKWAGGKSKLLDDLAMRAPARYARYYEPFLGGGALFFRLAPERAVIGDGNADLMNMYRCVAWHVEGVARRLSRLRSKHCEEHYYHTRSKWNAGRQRSDVSRAAAFIYLNKTCYNGLWRVNSKGLFNVPIGRYESPQIYHLDHLRAVSVVLRDAEMRTGDYRETVRDAGRGDFVYFDPPYQPLSTTSSFTSYTADNFGADDQRELAHEARRLAAAGAFVMVSNHDTPFVRKLYRGFAIDVVRCARAINSKASKRGAVAELIITNR